MPGERKIDAASVQEAVEAELDRSVRSVERIERGKNAVYRVAPEEGGEPDAVVKVGTASSGRVAVEPAVMDRVRTATDLPVPDVPGRSPGGDGPLDHPWFLAEWVPGRTPDLRSKDLQFETLARVCREAGRNLGALHAAFSLDGVGPLVEDGEDLAPPNPVEKWPTLFERVVRSQLEELSGSRFDDALPAVEEALADAVAAMERAPPPDPVLCHLDYRLGNLVVRSDDRPATAGILDWGGAAAAPPAYELAHTEGILLDWPRFDADRTTMLRNRFYEGYEECGGGRPALGSEDTTRWYRLPARLRLMKHLDQEMAGRPDVAVDRRAHEHVAALEELLGGV